MKITNMQTYRRPTILAAALLTLATLSACNSVPYRCPLDPEDKANSPTACSNMHDALEGSKRGTGGRTSVFLDDKGRIVPREIFENRAASPLVNSNGSNEAYYPTSGQPVFQQPKVFQTWSGAYQDSEGNLHDGHTSWFTTPGRWTRGTMDSPGAAGELLLRPVNATERPKGRVVATDRSGTPITTGTAGQPRQTPEQAKRSADSEAMNSLSQAANQSAAKVSPQTTPNRVLQQSAAGVTAPAVLLGN